MKSKNDQDKSERRGGCVTRSMSVFLLENRERETDLPAKIISRLSESNSFLPAAVSGVCSIRCPMISGFDAFA